MGPVGIDQAMAFKSIKVPTRLDLISLPPERDCERLLEKRKALRRQGASGPVTKESRSQEGPGQGVGGNQRALLRHIGPFEGPTVKLKCGSTKTGEFSPLRSKRGLVIFSRDAR